MKRRNKTIHSITWMSDACLLPELIEQVAAGLWGKGHRNGDSAWLSGSIQVVRCTPTFAVLIADKGGIVGIVTRQ